MAESLHRICRFALFVALASSGAASAQQTYTLKPRWHVGDQWAFDVSSSLQQKGTVTANGQPEPIDQSASQRRKGTIEILAVDHDLPTAVRVKYDIESKNSGTLGGQAAPPFSLVGRTITVRRATDGQISNDLAQQPDEQTQAELARLLDPDLSVYPTHPVAVGEEWDADSASLARQFQLGPDDKVSMKCTLRGIADLDGRQVAEIATIGQVTKHDEGFIVTTTHLDGLSRIDLATGQTLESDLTGKMSSHGTRAADASGHGGVTLDATGELKTHQQMTPIAIAAAAPVAASPPIVASAPVPASAPPPVDNPLARHATNLAGSYQGDGLSVDLASEDGHYTGTLTLRDKTFPLKAHADGNKLTGTFQASGSTFNFTANLDGETLTLVSDGNTYVMKRVPAVPTAPPPKNPLAQ